MLDTETIMFDARQNKGGTYAYARNGWFDRAHLPVGYMVSLPHGVENVPDAAMSWRFIRDLVESPEYADYLNGFGYYLGLWQDDNGRWSIDLSIQVDTITQAVSAGLRNGQRAIWDNHNGTAIDLGQYVQFGRSN